MSQAALRYPTSTAAALSETYQDDAFTPETALDAVLSHLDGVADVLRRSGRGCEGWLEEVAAYRIRLCSGEITQKKEAVVALSGRCHHQALGDANTVDYERYHQEVFELWRSCERLLRVYEKQAA